MDQQSGGAGTARVMGTWFIVLALMIGIVAANRPHLGYLIVAGLLALIGVGLRIEAAVRNLDPKARRPTSTGVDFYR